MMTRSPLFLISTPRREETITPANIDHTDSISVPVRPFRAAWLKWSDACKEIMPVYIGTHLACFVITCLSVLFMMKDFSPSAMPLYALWESWNRWDTGHYIFIALNGYDLPARTAFFPLYSLLIRAFMLFTVYPLTAGLLISSMTTLVMLIVLYRLVKEDFNRDYALRTVLYLSIFPTAFFFLAAYNESLFLCLSLLSFYNMRHGHWWRAGLFGLLASLTRSAGVFLLVPFYYEYLCQHQFNLKKIRSDVLSGGLIPTGVLFFGLYCAYRFQDFFAFSHAQASWYRYLNFPWYGLVLSFQAITIRSTGFLSFQALRNLTDLVPDLLVLTMIVLTFVGPWRFPRKLWAYGFYAATLYLFIMLFPLEGMKLVPLQSTSRFMLEIFPAFIVLAGIGGKSKTFAMSYLMVSGAIFFFLLAQFLTAHWVV